MTGRLEGQRALVTGGNSGIGEAIAHAFAGEGASIVIGGRRKAAGAKVVRDLGKKGVEATFVQADVRVERQVKAMVRQATKALGGIDILVNNAGTGGGDEVHKLKTSDWDLCLNTNARSAFLATREVLPQMRRRKRGWVVNIASMAGRDPYPGGAAYCASKAAMLALSHCTALENNLSGIKVVALCPGYVATPWFGPRPEREFEHGVLSSQDVAQTALFAVTQGRHVFMEDFHMYHADTANM